MTIFIKIKLKHIYYRRKKCYHFKNVRTDVTENETVAQTKHVFFIKTNNARHIFLQMCSKSYIFGHREEMNQNKIFFINKLFFII